MPRARSKRERALGMPALVHAPGAFHALGLTHDQDDEHQDHVEPRLRARGRPAVEAPMPAVGRTQREARTGLGSYGAWAAAHLLPWRYVF